MPADTVTVLHQRQGPAQHRGSGVLACSWLTDELAVLLLGLAGTDRPFLDRGRARPAFPSFPLEIGVESSTWLACVPYGAAADPPVLDGLELTRPALAAATVDLDTLHRRLLGSLGAETKDAIIEFLVLATAGLAPRNPQLPAALRLLRDGLRRKLPVSIIEASEPRAIAVDAIWQLDERAFYVEGWARHEGARVGRLVAVSPEGERVEIGESVFRYPRRDVDEFYGSDDRAAKLGFIAYFETKAASALGEGWLLELHDSLGQAVETAAPTVSRDLRAARHTLLADLALEQAGSTALKAGHIRPAIETLQRRTIGEASIETVLELGTRPAAPAATIVVPLYRRVDFLEHQLAAFVSDPELRGVELVYVLDSPEIADETQVYAMQLYRLYGVPFRLAVLDRNAGYATANNLGATLGTAPKLVLLNSDVLPETPGWVGVLSRFFDDTPQIGAVSPKLIYEDGTIQFAGLYFEQHDGADVWANEHYFKGIARGLPAANVARPVPAVTGACMMVEAAVFGELGGLNGGYIQGDYEDTDLCLRMRRYGLSAWYTPSATLYHLEGQSYPTAERRLASEYNRWLHTHLWNDQIELIAAAREPTPPTSRTRALTSTTNWSEQP